VANLTTTQATSVLKSLGFLIDSTSSYSTAVKGFQVGWNLGASLDVDGLVGPATSAALRLSDSNRKGGKGTASAHFSYAEFRCKCGGRYDGCRGTLTYRPLLAGLETYRARYGPTTIVSGYRCSGHNRAVGGATSSQHMLGRAADIPREGSWSSVRSLGVFTGIGKQSSSGLVQHVDRRSSATTSNPTIWNY